MFILFVVLNQIMKKSLFMLIKITFLIKSDILGFSKQLKSGKVFFHVERLMNNLNNISMNSLVKAQL